MSIESSVVHGSEGKSEECNSFEKKLDILLKKNLDGLSSSLERRVVLFQRPVESPKEEDVEMTLYTEGAWRMLNREEKFKATCDWFGGRVGRLVSVR